jgi:hypothetical protein
LRRSIHFRKHEYLPLKQPIPIFFNFFLTKKSSAMKIRSLLFILPAIMVLLLTDCTKDNALVDSMSNSNEPVVPTDFRRKCAADDVYQRMLTADPQFNLNRASIENFTSKYISSNAVQPRTVITIPVVVHVVWRTSAQNISDAQIQSQLAVLNQDFRRQNADATNTPAPFAPLAADAEVEFCLAARDPNGQATNGIVRRQTTVTSFSDNDAVKFYNQGGSNAWDATKYLNIWVCNLGGGILGYAQFPGGSTSTDGVVITNTAFGTQGSAQAPFNKGRTTTHEVGHWLNLYHIWGDDGSSCSGSDNVSDTPNQGDENYGCPSFPTLSCSNGPNGDMFMNYMDYTDDACMNIFTFGQKTRMSAIFANGGARNGLLSSLGCVPPSGGGGGGGGGSCGIPSGLAASNITTSSASLSWTLVTGASTYTLQHKLATSSTWNTVSNLNSTSYNLTGLNAGSSYQYRVQAICSGVAGSYSAISTFTTQISGGGGGGSCTDSYEPNNSSSSAAPIPVNTPITAMISTTTDRDWFVFNNSSTNRNIRITLTNLPADYDIYLYRGNTMVGWSENDGTNNEEIRFNTTVVGTYRVRVIGYNGANSSSQCYSLLSNISNTPYRLQDPAETQSAKPQSLRNE